MKRLLTILLIVLMALTVVGCAKKETVGDNTANPMTEIESLEKLNELVGGKLVTPGVMGVGNEKFFTITSDDRTIGDYQFEVNGDKCDFRFSDRGSLDEDFSGYYIDGKPAFPSENIENDIEYTFDKDVKLARWANTDGIYTFAYESKDMTEDGFKTIVQEFVELTKPKQGNVDGSLLGGFTQAENSDITEDIRTIVKEATDGLTGASYEPLALLGTQVVAGANYKVLCLKTTVTATPSYDLATLVIFKGLNDAKAELLDIEEVDTIYKDEHRNVVIIDSKDVLYITLNTEDGKYKLTTITYSFDDNDKLNKIFNSTVYENEEDATKAYDELMASDEALKVYSSLEGNRIIADATDVMLPEWGNITRAELIDTLKSANN